MRQAITILFLISIVAFTACHATSKSNSNSTLTQELDEKNRATISLLNRIQRLSGISLRNNVPVFGKGTNSFEGSGEPLYVLNDYIVGNSFSSVNELVESFNVKKIETLTASEASIYGSRAASGVIKITTYK